MSGMGILSSNYNNPAFGGEKRTNADRIRQMSDEELAKHICCPHDICEGCFIKDEADREAARKMKQKLNGRADNG